MSVVEKIQHYQRNIKKCCNDEDKMLYYIQKLYTLPVTVQHLQDTGVGRTVNALRKYEGGVGDAAKALVAKWKAMVADEETSDGEDEDEACVPDAPESYSDSPESPKLKEKRKADSTVKISRHKSDSSKHRHQQKTEKNETSQHNSKYSGKQETKVKSSENQPHINKESSKSSKTESQKQKYEKNHHSSKHESKQEKRSSSNDLKISNSTHSRKSSDKLSHGSKADNIMDENEENNKKRKLDSSNNGKKKSKKRKHSDSESDEDKNVFYDTEKQNSDVFETESDKKPEIVAKQDSLLCSFRDKDVMNKNEGKSDKSKLHEKLKHNSSKQEHDDRNKKKLEANKEKHKVKDSHHSYKSSKSKNHSSSSKDHIKDKEKNRKKEHEEGKHKHQNKNGSDSRDTKSSSKESKEKVKMKQEINGDEGIDCNSGASFAEALGMCTVAPSSRKRHNNSPNLSSAKVKSEPNTSSTLNNKKQSSVRSEVTSSDSLHPLSLLAPNVKLEPLSVDLASTLPEISPNYKPLPYINPLHRKEEDKALTNVIYVKNQRTKVYSGNKTGYTSVPSLYEMCIRVLIDNIDALEFTGGVPYDIIKPVLERATADQLFMLEHYNPYLIEDTDSLWQFHCSREFRNKQREEMETWREMYMRCLDEREAKLKTLTANIKQSIDKTVPLRSAKLAYVDNVVKPPRNVLKKQAKYGTANSLPTSTSDLKKKLIVGGGPTAATNISVPPPPMNRVKTSSGVAKKTKAPLMAKALQLIKGRYKR